MLGAVALVLLIACANLTTMLLARAAAHEREMAIRVALGAGPLRVLRQVLTESVMLALLGGVAGILLAIWGVDLLKSIGAQTVPRLREVNLDLRVLITTFAVSVGTGIVFGLVPGLASAKPELTESLKEGGRNSTVGKSRNRLRNALVIAEVALALVLLTSAGLLMKSFVRLQNVNPGFDSHHVLTAEVSLPKLQYPDNKSIVHFGDEAQRRIAALPGIQAVGLTTVLPLAGTNGDSSFAIEGRPDDRSTPNPDEEKREVSPDYFRAIGTLTSELVVKTARIVARDLAARFGISRPRIVVAGLNPHAGEQGALGEEDGKIVAPAVKQLQAEGIDAIGPLPADTLFHERARASYDVALCMYHDQALIPIKTLAFDHAVNVTLGLPFVRTSPDHGTAFDIAGKGTANPSSLLAALTLAARLSATAPALVPAK